MDVIRLPSLKLNEDYSNYSIVDSFRSHVRHRKKEKMVEEHELQAVVHQSALDQMVRCS